MVSDEPRPDDTVGVPVSVDPSNTATGTAPQQVPPVVAAPVAAPIKPSFVAQKLGVGVVHKPVLAAKKPPLARPVSAGVRAPAPPPFKPTVERNPYLR
jgi:hypothetical protein